MGAWVTHPLKPAIPGTAPNRLVEEQPPADESVATVDPLVGLVAMQVSTSVCVAATSHPLSQVSVAHDLHGASCYTC